jgi:predicted lipoprotein with Yx(FWY)xxD motif
MSHKTNLFSVSSGVMMLSLILAACMPASPAAPAAQSAASVPLPAVIVSDNPALGKILTDGQGKTLYLYTKDTPGVSNCSGTCLTNWPPLLVPTGTTPSGSTDVTAKLGTIQRSDGSSQVTINDMPAYYWIKDAKPGDATGQNVGGVWFVFDPGGKMVK